MADYCYVRCMKHGLGQSYRSNWLVYFIFNFCCFAVILGIAFFFKTNLKPLHPLKKGLDDFSFTDIYYKINKPDYELSKHRIPAQPELYVVNIGTLNRAGIAEVIDIINEGEPAVLSLDVVFHEKVDTTGTAALLKAMEASETIVQGYISDDREYCADGIYSMDALRIGKEAFINLPGSDPVNTVIRYFKPFHNKDLGLATTTAFTYLEKTGTSLNHRQSKLKEATEKETKKCYSKKKYTIRFNRLLSEIYNNQFINHTEVTDADFDPSVLKDKIVLLGYRGEIQPENVDGLPQIHPEIDEDMYFTPLNKNMTGRSYPDMYGVDIQANIISNVLRGNYIIKISDVWSWVIAFLLCLILSPLMIYFFVNQHIWFHIVAKLLQLFLSIVFVMIGVVVYANGFYLNSKPIVISIILIVDLMYFYDAFVKYIAHRRQKQNKEMQSVFLVEH